MSDQQSYHPHHHNEPHIGEIVNELVSKLAPFSGIILTVTACIVAIFRIYCLELFIIPKLYPARLLKSLSDGQKRGFINHHVAALTKIILLPTAGYPLLAILAGHATPHTPYFKGSTATLGDVMIVCTQLFTVMYIFELFYREKVSPISCAHHIGAIVIAQSAVAMSINYDHEKDAVIEFILCFIWGGFDVVAELWPHIAMIVYRTHANNHRLLAKMFYATMWLELVGTLSETIIVMWLFGSLWDHWSISLKVCTPILHLLFTAAQLWGAWIFRNMANQHRRLINVGEKKDEEALKQTETQETAQS
ncbi:Hypothetical protein R9X50_00219000 [Acrodontium crateriforme]|uniref:TLC domain-containing protein n=1 Tax=Acrodontium crateriforme TaxID=150365 RepID=A0AAQ3M1T2_9PEZI|nr:Hypothetical protein R9X50_00219000 [Acrodontium crateriforme]